MRFLILLSSFFALSLCSLHQNNSSLEECESFDEDLSDYFSEEEPRHDAWAREKLDRIYNAFEKDIFVEVKKGRIIKGNYYDVDMERYVIVSEGEIGVGTKGLSTCYAICGVGHPKHHPAILVLAHFILTDPQSVLEKLTDELNARNCLNESIAFYILGGSADDESKEVLYDFLSLINLYNIKGALYNPICIDEDNDACRSIDVIFTKDRIFYGEEIKFSGSQTGHEF